MRYSLSLKTHFNVSFVLVLPTLPVTAIRIAAAFSRAATQVFPRASKVSSTCIIGKGGSTASQQGLLLHPS